MAPSCRSTMVSTSGTFAPHRLAATWLSGYPPGGGDVLDDDDALAVQRLAWGQPLDRGRAPCSFGFLRTKKSGIGLPRDPAHRATAPEIGTAPISRPPIESDVRWSAPRGQLREERRAFGIEHGRLQVEVEVALSAGGERDFAETERALRMISLRRLRAGLESERDGLGQCHGSVWTTRRSRFDGWPQPPTQGSVSATGSNAMTGPLYHRFGLRAARTGDAAPCRDFRTLMKRRTVRDYSDRQVPRGLSRTR